MMLLLLNEFDASWSKYSIMFIIPIGPLQIVDTSKAWRVSGSREKRLLNMLGRRYAHKK